MRIGINGLGRIGRTLLRVCFEHHKITPVVINELSDNATLAHLIKYDSVHGKFNGEIQYNDEGIIVNGHFIAVSHQNNIENINWKKYQLDAVCECTGHFLDRDSAQKHILQGAKRVILSAPPKESSIKTIVLGVNEHLINIEDTIISNASCTTNSAAPLIKVINDLWSIKAAFISTTHSYTGDQRLIDAPHHDLRRARAAALSIIPTTTGAAKALTKVFPTLEGKIGGGGIRVPVPDGSLTDITMILGTPVTEEEVNRIFKKAAETNFKGIIEYTQDPVVSTDIIGNTHSVVFDSLLTSVVGPMVKVVGWYDNEVGYCNRLHDLLLKIHSL